MMLSLILLVAVAAHHEPTNRGAVHGSTANSEPGQNHPASADFVSDDLVVDGSARHTATGDE
jgi:hypothetical protein